MSDSYTDIRQRLSIVITVFNCDDLVDRCLTSLARCFNGVLPETIVVDNAGLDSTKALMARHGVRYERMPKDGGFAGANNVGLRLCTREFVCLVNSDTVFHDNPFQPLLDFMDGHPKAQIAQGTVILKNGIAGQDGKLDDSGVFFTPMGTVEMFLRLLDPDDPRVHQPERVFSAYGAMFFFRRKWIDHLNGILFHDHFYAYNEEVDLCHRTGLAGGEIWYVPTPPVDHAHSATFKRNFDPRPIRSHLLYNCRYSLLTCLSPWSILKICPLFELYYYTMALIELPRDHGMELKLQVCACAKIIRDCRQLLAMRRQVQSLRTLSDRKFFETVMRPPTFAAYCKRALERRRAAKLKFNHNNSTLPK